MLNAKFLRIFLRDWFFPNDGHTFYSPNPSIVFLAMYRWGIFGSLLLLEVVAFEWLVLWLFQVLHQLASSIATFAFGTLLEALGSHTASMSFQGACRVYGWVALQTHIGALLSTDPLPFHRGRVQPSWSHGEALLNGGEHHMQAGFVYFLWHIYRPPLSIN